MVAAVRLPSSPRRRTAKPEVGVQQSVVAYLRRTLPAGFLVVAVSNNPRSAAAGAREKSMGMLKGWPDLAIYGRASDDRPFAGFIECKAPGGRVRPEQQDVLDQLADCGHGTAIVRSIEDAQRAVLAWDLPSKDMLIRDLGGASA